LKSIFLIISLVIFSYASSVDCNQIFESRKSELLQDIEKIDEARQSFEALKAATNALFDKQKKHIEKENKELAEKKMKLAAKKKQIEELIAKNQKLLDIIKGAKDDKMSETYSKMKDSAAASIFEDLSAEEASSILFTLPANKISKILAKMDPRKASSVTLRLKKGPPFDKVVGGKKNGKL